MVSKKVDFILVGQGIAGSWLALELIKRNYSIHVINKETEDTASFKAAGLYNPITGRKMKLTWKAEELFSDLENNYREAESLLQTNFLHSKSIYRPFREIEEKNDWDGKIDDDITTQFVEQIHSESLGYKGIKDPLGGLKIKKSGYVDLKTFILSLRRLLIDRGFYHPKVFDYSEVEFKDGKVDYKGIQAQKVIFCEGPNTNNPFWNELPFKLVRGEVIDIECGLKADVIINRGVFIIPKGNYHTVGSTYDHKVLSFQPQKEGIEELKRRFGQLFEGPYRIVEKRAGVRPATYDRKPFIGISPINETLGIFNGFGTKGVSLAPYFAKQFVDTLEGKSKIEKQADVQRVY